MEWIGIIIGGLLATVIVATVMLASATAQRDNAIHKVDKLVHQIEILKMELLMERK